MNRLHLAAFLCLFGSGFLYGQGTPAGTIRVSGHGEVPVSGESLVIKARLEVSAEVAGDAMKKFADQRRRLDAKLKELEIESLSVSGEGFGVRVGVPGGNSNNFMVMNGRRSAPDPEVQAGEMVVVTVAGLAEQDAEQTRGLIADILDCLKEEGLKLGVVTNSRVFSSVTNRVNSKEPGIYFRPAGRRKVETEAYRLALDDARDRASRLAELSGLKLGGVVSIVAVTAKPPALGQQRRSLHEVDLQVTYGIEQQ